MWKSHHCRAIDPQKSAPFLAAIREGLTRLVEGNEEPFIDLMNIWVQFKSGIHMKHNPDFFEFVQNSIPTLINRLNPSADRSRYSLCSLLYSLWIYTEKQGSSNVMVQNRLMRHFTSCLQTSQPTLFFVSAFFLSHLLDSTDDRDGSSDDSMRSSL